MAGQVVSKGGASEISIRAVVVRCGCGDPQSHRGAACPRPRRRENRGVVSFFHTNPLMRLAFKLGLIQRLRAR